MNKRNDIRSRKKEIEEMYLSGKSAKSISSFFSCSRPTITNVLSEIGVKTRPPGGSDAKRLYADNDDFFETPNQKNSYWAGFIAADGCVFGRRLKVNLSIKDFDHLKKFRDSVSPARPIYNIKSRNGHSPQCGLEVSSKKISNDLFVNFGIYPNKSLTISPPNLSTENSMAFIIGYIDGDGSVGFGKSGRFFFSVVGTKDMVTFIAEHLVRLNPSLRMSIRKSGNIFRAGGTCGRVKEALGSLLIKTEVPFMERKWQHVLA